MEESPLTKAHDHARAASNATHQAESTVAVNEHALAAGEFANAAKSTTSIDALRTLKLLEDHHQRLADLLKLPVYRKLYQTELDEKEETPETAATGHGSAEDDAPVVKAEQTSSPAAAAAAALENTKAGGQVPSLAQKKRYPARPMTSSIASNLASARGIRSRDRGQPVPPSVTNDQAPGNLEVSPRREKSDSGSRHKMQNVLEHSSGKPGWVPPGSSTGGGQHRASDSSRKELDPLEEVTETTSGLSPAASVPTDDNYSRFYNTFGGIINRLSAPLAFAGLPLVAEDESSQTSPSATMQKTNNTTRDISPATSRRSSKHHHHRHNSPASQAEPDLSKIYSRATMRAVSGGNPTESFYVVPTSGHTMSYANILNYADKEKRRLEASLHVGGEAGMIEEEEDDFVDARESPSGPPSPVTRRGRAGAGVGGGGGGGRGVSGGKSRAVAAGSSSKTDEELALENKSLKEVLDKLSKRLQLFEASAQDSHRALAESIRLRRPGSPLNLSAGSAGGSADGGDDGGGALRVRNKDLEEQVALALKRMDTLEKENQKMKKTIGKYRDKWESLMAGARARRGAQGGITEEDPGAS